MSVNPDNPYASRVYPSLLTRLPVVPLSVTAYAILALPILCRTPCRQGIIYLKPYLKQCIKITLLNT